MKRTIVAAILIAILSAATLQAEKIGLVLSGGGAKGIAHVGVIKALEENGIPVDYVTGTSMGAIVGGLYSCGWSPEQMMALFTSKDFHYWSTGTIDPALTFYFNQPDPTPGMLSVNVNFRDSTTLKSNILKGSLINPLPMNYEFLRLFSPYTEQCAADFDNLFVPFRCVCSDVYHKHKIVLGSGSLDKAIRASMSFPLVFKPIEMNGVLVYDGGIYDNFPVDVMHDEFDPQFIVGVSVSGPDGKPIPGNMYEQLEDMIIQNNDYSVPPEEGIKIQVPVLDFGVLDFGKADEIYNIGYRTGLAMVDSIKKRTVARRPLSEVEARRVRFRAATPEIRFDSLRVEGGTPGENAYINYVFESAASDSTLNMDQVRDAYYRVITSGKVSDMLPLMQRDSASGKTILDLKSDVNNNWTAGIGGWLTSSVHSMLYLQLGYHTLSFNSLDISLSGWIGQSYYAGMLSGKIHLRTQRPSFLQIEGVLSRQKYYDSELLFYQSRTPSFISDRENYIRLNYVWAMGRKSKGWISGGYADICDSYYNDRTNDFANTPKDKSQYRDLALRLGMERNTLDNQVYPSSGSQFRATLAGVWESWRYLPEGKAVTGFRSHPELDVEVFWRNFFPVHRNFVLGASAQGVAAFRKLNQNYTATMVREPAFGPTPSTANYFNPRFRAGSYVAVGAVPVFKPMANLQLRGDFYLFMPVRNIVAGPDDQARYDGWFCRAEFLGEIAAVYNLPFASFSIYCNYLSYPSRNWNFGISLGLPFQAPRFRRGSL